MKHQIAHDLDMGLAKEAAVRAFEAYQQRFADYQPKLVWNSERDARIDFTVKGMKLSGSLGTAEVDRSRPRCPFVFRLFKSKAIEVIEREVQVWLDKAKRGELSPKA